MPWPMTEPIGPRYFSRGDTLTDQPIEIRTPFVLDFSGNDHKAGDFRPKVSTIPKKAEEPEETDPKDLSAQVPASSSNLNQLELDLKGKTASVEKDSGQLKASGPGKLTLPPASSTGKQEPTAKV
mgnify:CR=1 FL=1